jgi:DNA (cytosine-5)-methyltransferase 1
MDPSSLRIETDWAGSMPLRVAELFAGVGGFRLALEGPAYRFVWSNQWEPGKKAQWASDCYIAHFGAAGHSNQDIATVDASSIPDHDLLVGGFPCQDYSVAATLDKSGGIEGKKGVLWWEIVRILRAKRPSYILLENVDRLLKSPARQRGRDFAIALSSLAGLGYRVEWRVLNSGDHGSPQRRRRVFILGAHETTDLGRRMARDAPSSDYLVKTGFFADCFPVRQRSVAVVESNPPDTVLDRRLTVLSRDFTFEFQNSGAMVDGKVWTCKVEARREPLVTLRSVLQEGVADEYFVAEKDLERWKYLKGSKREKRTARNGHRYLYSEGAIPFPDLLDQPSRTLLTSEGGTSPSRIKHLILDPQRGRHRVLTPVECERLSGFPEGWTEGMPERWRYFTMGNALVVDLVHRIGEHLVTSFAKPTIKVKIRTARQKKI